jgi:hypothetical protein
MSLPADVREAALPQVERFCEKRIPEKLRAQMRLAHGVRGNAITIVERRPPWSELVGSKWTATKIAHAASAASGPAPTTVIRTKAGASRLTGRTPRTRPFRSSHARLVRRLQPGAKARARRVRAACFEARFGSWYHREGRSPYCG